MNAARFKQLQDLFEEAADLPPAEQETFLKAACGNDTELLADLQVMLEEDARDDSLLDSDLAQVAYRVFNAKASFSPGSVQFGPYRLIRVLGEGGMGIVYLAERDDLRNQVAIKMLRDAWLSPARRERFASEQRMLAQLNHPSIARLYDAGVSADGIPWFALEYVDGVPITEYCRTQQPSLENRLKLFRSVCEAVQFAHEQAVIHRDLKPSNILVEENGVVKLLDFGIAKHLDALHQPVDQTRTELRMMTPAFAAPEQIRGERVGIFTDVYALGLILYALLTGQPPFDLANRTLGETERMILEGNPPKPSAVVRRSNPLSRAGRSAWADLDVLCLTAMHKDVERRYRSVEALIRDVDHYVKGEPLEARPDSLRYRTGKFVRRNWRPLSLAAGLSIVAIALIIFFTVRLAVARNTAVAAVVRAGRVQTFMLNLFNGGDKLAPPAENLRVLTLVDRGVQEAQALRREPEVQAELYSTLGSIYQKLGRFDQADPLLRRALRQRQSMIGPDRPETAESLTLLGLLRLDQGRFDEAEKLVRQGQEGAERARPRDNAAIAEGTMALGKVLAARGDFKHAIPLLEQSVKLQSVSGTVTPELAATTKELADAYFSSGRYDLCETLNQRLLVMHRQLNGERHPLIADDLIDLASVRIERGYYAEAERFLRQALDIDRAWYGPDHPEIAAILYQLSEAIVYEKRFAEAEPLLQQALAIRERVYGPEHPFAANVLGQICALALQQDQFAKAESCYTRVLNIYKTAYGNHHQYIGVGLSNLGSVYLNGKQYARAEPLFREALALYKQILPANHSFIGVTEIKLGRTLARQGHYTEAEEHTLAGYQILSSQSNPAVHWLQAARTDLAAIYDALHQPEKARQIRMELASDTKSMEVTAKR
jgi:eukaryotic-like serine/threonine-protein kinase